MHSELRRVMNAIDDTRVLENTPKDFVGISGVDRCILYDLKPLRIRYTLYVARRRQKWHCAHTCYDIIRCYYWFCKVLEVIFQLHLGRCVE